MIDSEKKLIIDWTKGDISEDTFWVSYGLNRKNFVYILDGLSKGLQQKDPEMIEYLILIYFNQFEGRFNKSNSDILYELIVQDWHKNHEDLVMIIKRLKSIASIPYLLKAMELKLDYLEYNDGESLIRKCAYAISDIDANMSMSFMEDLSKSDNEIISKSAIEQLDRLKNH